MTTPETVPAYFVIAENIEGKTQDVGMFFRVTDADAFLVTLKGTNYKAPRIEPRAVLATDLHPAHQELFPKLFKAAKK